MTEEVGSGGLSPRMFRMTRCGVHTVDAKWLIPAGISPAAVAKDPTLNEAMADPKAPWSAKITAAIAVLDRGWGKPEQTVSANVSVFDQMTDDEQKTMLAALEALKDA